MADEQLRFVKDLRPKVAFTGSGHVIEMLVRHVDGEEEWIKVTPNQSMAERMGGLPTIGIFAAASTEFGKMTKSMAERLPGFEDKDQVTAVIIEGDTHEVEYGWQIERLLAAHPAADIAFRVQRMEDGTAQEVVFHDNLTPRSQAALVIEHFVGVAAH